MNASSSHRDSLRETIRERVTNAAALIVLLAIGTLALAGPSGVLAWSEDAALLEQHRARIAQLREDRSALENRVELLNPDNVDPDLGSELVRRDLNVVHPDEYVIELDIAE